MSIYQLNMHGKNMIEVAIERLKFFEPDEGYYLAFSGGKDSVVIKALADMAKVKYDAHYNLTSVDHPELVQFVKGFDDVNIDVPRYKDGMQITMWNLIPKKKIPPTRIARYCCEYLKESQGEDRFVVTGVRKAESAKRKNRGGLEVGNNKNRDRYDPDNQTPEMFHICKIHSKKILNPIYDWETDEVWEFIKDFNISYCKLYDQGYKRLGCIGCPMSTNQANELEEYPKYKRAYIKAFERMLEHYTDKNKITTWKNAQEVYDWWITNKSYAEMYDDEQINMLER